MNKRAFLAACAMACVVALAACSAPAPRVQPGEVLLRQGGTDDADVRAMVFAHMLRTHPKGEVAFISFGMTNDAWVSPPASFLARLGQSGMIVAPASQARIPALGKMAKGGGLEVIHDSSGKRGRLYFVRIKTWLDDDSADVEGGIVESTVPSGGIRCTVRRVTGKTWRIEGVDAW